MKAMTPPMGFNTWNRFLDERDFPQVEQITFDSVVALAKAMVDSGMKDAGYEYFVMDDGFQGYSRDHRGRLQGHARRFRPGIPALVEEVKSLGLKMGIYSVPGRYTLQVNLGVCRWNGEVDNNLNIRVCKKLGNRTALGNAPFCCLSSRAV